VAQYLAQNGFTNVSNIAGGIAAWAQSVDSNIPQY
jgi:rhodanese-related sulfurtransferase